MPVSTILERALLVAVFAGVILTGGPGLAYADECGIDRTMVVTVDLPDKDDYQITESIEGQRIAVDGWYWLAAPGRPMLPARNYLIALPPGAVVRSVKVRGIGPRDLPGEFRIVPAPPSLPLGLPDHCGQQTRELLSEYNRKKAEIYTSDKHYPSLVGRTSSRGRLGNYVYASVLVCPLRYNPESGKLVRYTSAEIALLYSSQDDGYVAPDRLGSAPADRVAGRQASELFVNYDRIKHLYLPTESPAMPATQSYDYVIITTSALADTIAASGFVSWKTDLGYTVRVVRITDSEITSQPGHDLAEQIRNFLRAYYVPWDIQYVLLVGKYDTVPMRYCYPDSTNHTNTAGTPGGSGGEVPTDCYYADLSSSDADSWDSDGDGYYGEYGQDDPDFGPEVYVGRIPVNNLNRIAYALNKTMAFEQDTGAWKNSALHAGAFWYFTNENGSGYPAMDGARSLAAIESDVMSGWTVSRYSEQEGLEKSVYPWDALTHDAFTTDWRTGQYSVVNWGAHGWTNSIARKVWAWDDGDSIPESNEVSWPDIVTTLSNLDDDHPSTVFAMSCLIGCPETNDWGRMGVDLLTLPGWGASIGVIASARSPYGTEEWPPGGSESICYEFNKNMISDYQKVGEAFYNAKFYCNSNYGWDHYAEYVNMYTFNLFGDPSLTREGIDLAGITSESSSESSGRQFRLSVRPNPTFGNVTLRFFAPKASPAEIEIYDILGRMVRTICDSRRTAGWHELTWDGHDEAGRPVAGGIYWVRAAVPGHTRTTPIIFLR